MSELRQLIIRHLPGGREDRRGWYITFCPFHPDSRPSLGVGQHGAFCFGCGYRAGFRRLARDLGLEVER